VFKRLLSKKFWKNVWARSENDQIFGRAAQLSYFFLLALFPLLLFLITLFGYFNGEGSHLQERMIAYLADVMPPAALQLVVATLDEITKGRGTGKLSLGILLSGEALAARINAGQAFSITWQALQIPFALVFVVIALVMIYRFVPNVAAKRHGKGLRPTDYRRRWFSPGIICAVLLWLLVSLGFRLYLHFFNSYSTTYGSLGALIILMLWFYLTGAAILLGGEINCEYESEVRD